MICSGAVLKILSDGRRVVWSSFLYSPRPASVEIRKNWRLSLVQHKGWILYRQTMNVLCTIISGLNGWFLYNRFQTHFLRISTNSSFYRRYKTDVKYLFRAESPGESSEATMSYWNENLLAKVSSNQPGWPTFHVMGSQSPAICIKFITNL